ncbi:aldose 1-epimerase family protein [Dermabacteraceae bacterium P13077]
MSLARDPQGERYTIRAGAYEAEITQVGATLARLHYDSRPVILETPEGEPMWFYRGALVAPWPNRIADGRYTCDGETYQVALSEPERGNALHGLVSFQAYELLEQDEDRVVLATTLFPTTGYPFHLRLVVEYSLDAAAGLHTRLTAENVGSRTAPYGCCPHPYLVAGPEPLDTWTLAFDAHSQMQVDPERLLPLGTGPVDPGSPQDFHGEGRVIGDTKLDTAFSDLLRDFDGNSFVTVTAPGGTGVEVSFGYDCSWVQIYTGDRPEPELNRLGLAVEPMTCPPDAFNSGMDLIRLAPGQAHSASWRIRAW